MRLWLALGGLLLAGCAAPHSTGALWAQQNLEREAALFRAGEAQRAEQAHAFELTLAGEALAAERMRVEAELQDCPGERRPLGISTGDKVRDTIRLRVGTDSPRVAALAQVAQADWYLRRGRATGEGRMCEAARSALTIPPNAAPRTPVIDGLGEATVARDARRAAIEATGEQEPLVTLSLYATQAVDRVRAAAPLPQYLAAVYGGELQSAPPPNLAGQPPEAVVDDLATAYPEWEPDALYVALRGGPP